MSNRSVFDRLSTTPTAASSTRDSIEKALRTQREERAAKEAALSSPRNRVSSPSKVSSPLTSPKRTSKQQQNDFFEKIYKQETASSAAHHADIRPQDPYKSPSSPKSPTTNLGEMKLFLVKDKSNTPFDLTQQSHHEIRTSLQSYSHHKLSARSVCVSIIETLFHKEYVHRPKWEVYPGEAEGVEGVWHVEKRAIKDYKGSFGVASAKAKIRFIGNEVFVEDYLYSVSE